MEEIAKSIWKQANFNKNAPEKQIQCWLEKLSSAASVSHDSAENVINSSTYHSNPDKRCFPKGVKDPKIVVIDLSDSNHIVIPVSIQGLSNQGVLDSGANTCLINRECNKTLNTKPQILWVYI